MSNALLTGVSGLKVNQEMLDVVGNNLANSNTTAFKEQRLDFSDLIYQTLTPASGSSSPNISGTNPVQVGLGVGVAGISTDQQQGGLESTGRDLDLALQGNGYFVAKTASDTLYTRSGTFDVDSGNYLVDPSTGYRIQRFGNVGEPTATTAGFQVPGNDDIIIPQGQTIPGKQTNGVTLQGNLSAGALGPVAQVLQGVQPLTAGGAAATTGTLLNDLDSNTVDYVPGDNLTLAGTAYDGTAVNITVPVDGTTTVNDLLNAVNTNFPGSTASLDPNGNILLTAGTSGQTSLSLAISDVAGGAGQSLWSASALGVATPGKDGDTASGSIQVYDLQGTAHDLTFTFQKTANNTWNMTSSINPADGTLTQSTVTGITFNDDGSFAQVSGGGGNTSITAQFAGMASPQTISFNLGASGGFNGITQVGGSATAAATAQDGYASGSLVNVSFDHDGTINGNFSNGKSLKIAQLAIASFSNPDALDRVGNNYYHGTTESGPPQVSTAQSGGNGAVEQKVLEQSNVDVSLEFTRLITAQRGFQINAKTITVADEVLQSLADIVR